MSRYLTYKENGKHLEEIESMKVCKWRINEVCCNGICSCVGDYPYPSERCYEDNYAERCQHFEKEDGIINK